MRYNFISVLRFRGIRSDDGVLLLTVSFDKVVRPSVVVNSSAVNIQYLVLSIAHVRHISS